MIKAFKKNRIYNVFGGKENETVKVIKVVRKWENVPGTPLVSKFWYLTFENGDTIKNNGMGPCGNEICYLDNNHAKYISGDTFID